MIYEGKGKYIFISYAHKDSHEVMPIINALSDNGYRVWYDSGIEAGTEWPEYIEEHIINSEVVIVFMSPAAIESRNCRNEINFALELKKEVLVIYLERTTLLKGMRLQLNSTQSLYKENHASFESFMENLLNARLLSECREQFDSKFNSLNHTSIKNTVKSFPFIRNVCSIGSNKEEDWWPDGEYSQTINCDEFKFVYFHISLSERIGFSGRTGIKSQIYNSHNNLIFDTVFELEVEEDYDRFSVGWILKGEDGSFIPSGEYRFVCSVNNSPEFCYYFTVSANAKGTMPSKNKSDIPNKSTQNSGGCYVATCVYGSYDCPEVWTLRRFRDYKLDTMFLGKIFIKIYYAISPILVKWLGNARWFKKFWRIRLDSMVKKLQAQGYENTEYNDKY